MVNEELVETFAKNHIKLLNDRGRDVDRDNYEEFLDNCVIEMSVSGEEYVALPIDVMMSWRKSIFNTLDELTGDKN